MTKMTSPSGALLLAALSLAGLSATGCSVLTDSTIAPSGIGARCSTNTDCQGSTCSRGICVSKCTVNSDCPAPTKCVQQLCQAPLDVAGIWVGVVAGGEGWTLTHQEGVQEARNQLGYVSFDYKEGLIGPPVEEAVDDFVNQGAGLIIANSFDHRNEISKKAKEYPDTTFMICSGQPQPPNVGAYFGHLEQAWYVAGEIAAQRATKHHRLGFVGSYVTPEVIRHLNAFTRGARHIDPKIVTEVRWLGFWYDTNSDASFEYTPHFMGTKATKLSLFGEEYLAAKLIDSGVDVIAHQCDNQRISRFVEKMTKNGTLLDNDGNPREVWTIANDNRYGWKNSEGTPISTALGSTYWNWAPMYERIFDQVHRGVWKPTSIMDSLIEDHQKSTVGFEVNPAVGLDEIQVRGYLNKEVQAGYGSVFRGPLTTTGQRAKIPAGQEIDEKEWRSMCWFIDGVIEKTNPNDPNSADRAAQVPTTKYNQTVAAEAKEPQDPTKRKPTQAPELLIDLGLGPGVIWNCDKNQ